MKKNSWAGWKDVFQFTISQNMKNKSFIVSSVVITLVVALMCIGINLVPALIFDIASKKEVKTVDVNTIYIVDESGRDKIDYSNLVHTKGMPENLVVVEATKVEGEQKEEEKELFVTIEKEELGYKVSTVLKNSGVSKKDANAVLDMVAEYFKQAHYKDLGITEEQVAFNQLEVSTKVNMLNEKQTNFVVLFVEYFVNLLIIVVFMLLISSYGRMSANAIAMEKSSKVIELLLTSVRPVATIAGKVIAMSTLLTGQLVLWILSGTVCFYGSKFVLAGIDSKYADGFKELLTMLKDGGIKLNLSPLVLILAVAILVTGFMTYITIASLAGATVSKIEELGEALQIFMLLSVAGAYLPLFGLINMITSEAANNTLLKISRILPISSLYLVPAEMMLGTNTISSGLISLGVNLVTMFVVILFVSKGHCSNVEE